MMRRERPNVRFAFTRLPKRALILRLAFTLVLLVPSISYAGPQSSQESFLPPAFNPPSQPGNGSGNQGGTGQGGAGSGGSTNNGATNGGTNGGPPAVPTATPATSSGNQNQGSGNASNPGQVALENTALGISVTGLFQGVLGRKPSAIELQNRVTQLQNSRDTRLTMQQMKSEFLASKEYYRIQVNKLYKKYLERPILEDGLQKLFNAKPRPTMAAVEQSLINSEEYKLKSYHKQQIARPYDAVDKEKQGQAPLEVCPGIPAGLMNVVCDAITAANFPGGHPWSIRYCCQHSAANFYEACTRAGMSCYTINIGSVRDKYEHSLNLVEDPKGTCRFADLSSGEIKIGTILFPCNEPSKKAICQAMNLPATCGWYASSRPPSKPYTIDSFTATQSDDKSCLSACTNWAASFYSDNEVAAKLSYWGMDPGFKARKNSLDEMTKEWAVECWTACQTRFSIQTGTDGFGEDYGVMKNFGTRFAMDCCMGLWSGCQDCCDLAIQKNELPSEYKDACHATCVKSVRVRKNELEGLRIISEAQLATLKWIVPIAAIGSPVGGSYTDLPMLLTLGRMVPYFRDGRSIGLQLLEVSPNSFWGGLNLKSGDILLSINDQKLGDTSRAMEMFKQLEQTPKLYLTFERDKREMTLGVTTR